MEEYLKFLHPNDKTNRIISTVRTHINLQNFIDKTQRNIDSFI